MGACKRMKIKTLIRHRTVTKCFHSMKHFFDFTTVFCGTILFVNTLILSV